MAEYAEYYERKTVERFLEGICEALCDNVEDDLQYVLYRMDEMVPADVKPVVQSKWKLNKDGSGTCQNCHCTQGAIWDHDNWQNYCGRCGADMRGYQNG